MSCGKHTNTSDTRAIEYHKITADPEEKKNTRKMSFRKHTNTSVTCAIDRL